MTFENVVSTAFGLRLLVSFRCRRPPQLQLETRRPPSHPTLQSHGGNRTYPMVLVRTAGGHVGDQAEDLVAEAAYVDNILALLRLCVAVWLDVDADHLRRRAAAFRKAATPAPTRTR